MARWLAVAVAVLAGCSSGASDPPATTTTTTTEATTTSSPEGPATTLAEAQARGYRFVDSMSGEAWVDDDGGYVYFESDDCRATTELLAQQPSLAEAWGPDTYKIKCFDVVNPTTSTPGP